MNGQTEKKIIILGASHIKGIIQVFLILQSRDI